MARCSLLGVTFDGPVLGNACLILSVVVQIYIVCGVVMVSDNTIRNPVWVTDKYRHIQNCSPMSCYQPPRNIKT